jgi:hypothetical protein
VTTHPRILLLAPWFGPWPEWIEFFLATCRWNRWIDFLFLGDCGAPGRLAPNVRHVPLTLADLSRIAEDRLGCPIALEDAYKVCDLRPAFGRIFAEHIAGYDAFGWTDIDVIYGDLRQVFAMPLHDYDVLSFNEEHLSGHLTIVRHTPQASNLYLAVPKFLDLIGVSSYEHLDEPHPNVLSGVRVHARESFNTPLSKLIPWTNGQFLFPTEWRWHSGSLTNDLDGDREFLYLHFMHWKGGAWPRECGNAQWEKLARTYDVDPATADRGFRVDATGFHGWDPSRAR